jgi:hypothetical protein
MNGTAAQTELPINKWIEWSRRDDWHLLFGPSDIRGMLAEIERLRKGAAQSPAQPHASEKTGDGQS